ncbi:hypothetical protein A4A49_30542 [Nicotiana attenuata]|uniref:Uncharacterized protein n=1 Tax=Nicotiana attenuata TaxID=49451 RepID=A0A1J6K1P9_NICAT|nr:hypothetical protein A4A49_30542 [Nicotiana attenuata]
MAKFSGNQKSWMEVVVPAVIIAPYRISVTPQLETIFEEDDFEDSDFQELLDVLLFSIKFKDVFSYYKGPFCM